jgi:hypothetical protein
MGREVEHLFMYLLALLPLPLKVPYSVYLPISSLVVDSLGVEFFEFPEDSGY